ncbi:MAG: beta strand repeat-containing protein [Coriobacteriia bacterium]
MNPTEGNAGQGTNATLTTGTATHGSTSNNEFVDFDFTGAALAVGQQLSFNGYIITAKEAMVAADIANDFALAAGVVTGVAAKSVGSGAFAALTDDLSDGTWSVTGAVLTVTDGTANTDSNSTVTAALTITRPTAATTPTALAVATTDGAGAATNGSLTLDKFVNNGTLELTAAGAGVTVTMADATGTADVLNIVTKVNASDLAFGTISAAGVETVNITATDTTPVNTTTGAATISKATMTLSDAAAKSVVITGNSDLALTAAGASLTSVNASAFTGKLTFSSAVNSATITGGTGADTLTATGSSQTLIGGEGNDTLVAGTLATLTGGAGVDTFDMTAQLSNVNSYATITDIASGDVIETASTVFKASAVTLASTAVFQDYANEAIKTSANTDITWFQFGGNTYVVQNDSASTSFVNGTDDIIKITGLVDLSTASFNATNGTIEIA